MTKKTGLIFFILLMAMPLLKEDSHAAIRVKDIETELMCMCEDKCGKMLSNCNCKYSDKMRAEIGLMLKDGLTKDDVLSFYTKRYGEKALSAPTKSGFNLTAWITPFVAIFFGGWAIKRVLSRWVSQKPAANPANNEKVTHINSANNDLYRDKLKKELDNFE